MLNMLYLIKNICFLLCLPVTKSEIRLCMYSMNIRVYIFKTKVDVWAGLAKPDILMSILKVCRVNLRTLPILIPCCVIYSIKHYLVFNITVREKILQTI